MVREGQAPEEVPEEPLPDGDPLHLPALLVERLGLGSTSEARRLIAQGAVKVDGEVVSDVDLPRERARRSARAGRESAASSASPRLDTAVRAFRYHSRGRSKGWRVGQSL